MITGAAWHLGDAFPVQITGESSAAVMRKAELLGFGAVELLLPDGSTCIMRRLGGMWTQTATWPLEAH